MTWTIPSTPKRLTSAIDSTTHQNRECDVWPRHTRNTRRLPACHIGLQRGAAAKAGLQVREGHSVQISVPSLIDLAGSEKATSDKEHARER
ncbi:hypothetical protein BD779DRAFT_1569512 [Infundibulicybe gibba]|nr:hypothetical protein BD779DRAFT_1569512 [Infundibulicybe gibba]